MSLAETLRLVDMRECALETLMAIAKGDELVAGTENGVHYTRLQAGNRNCCGIAMSYGRGK